MLNRNIIDVVYETLRLLGTKQCAADTSRIRANKSGRSRYESFDVLPPTGNCQSNPTEEHLRSTRGSSKNDEYNGPVAEGAITFLRRPAVRRKTVPVIVNTGRKHGRAEVRIRDFIKFLCRVGKLRVSAIVSRDPASFTEHR